MNVLLSIRPVYADKIFSGEKKFEFRKRVFKNKEVKIVVAYSTMPVGKIIGEFHIKRIHQDTPRNIWKKTKKSSGVDKGFFDEYYKDASEAVAIEIKQPVLYKESKDPKEQIQNFKALSFLCTGLTNSALRRRLDS